MIEIKCLEKIERLKKELERSRTGSPNQLAKRLGVTTRTLNRYIKCIEVTECVTVNYCRRRETYYIENSQSI
ncbi:MAG: HTH domain-containing protein [Breznakibacter sp.]